MSSMLNLESEASGRTPSKSEQTLLIYNRFRCRRTLKRKSLRSNNSNAMAYGAKHQIEEKEQKLKLKDPSDNSYCHLNTSFYLNTPLRAIKNENYIAN